MSRESAVHCFTSLPLSWCDHLIAILVNQGSDTRAPNLEQQVYAHPLLASPFVKGHAAGCGCPLCTGAAANLSAQATLRPMQQALKQHLPHGAANVPANGHPPGCSCPLCTGAARTSTVLGLPVLSALDRGAIVAAMGAAGASQGNLLAPQSFNAAALMGSAGSPVLIGGTGDDVLVGSRGRDLLIGGIGSAHLGASIESERLISGTGKYAQGDAALQHILNQWSINQDPEAEVEGSRENFDSFSYDGGNVNNSLDAVLTQARQSADALAVAALRDAVFAEPGDAADSNDVLDGSA